MSLLHVLTPDAARRWDRKAPLAPPSLRADGFVHLCTEAQLGEVRARHFGGGPVVVLFLDAGALDAEVRWEDLYGHGPFPHLYGPVPPGAVLRELHLSAEHPAARAAGDEPG